MRHPYLPRVFFAAVAIFALALAGGRAHAQGADAALIEQGKYLAAAGDCVSCHTRPGGEPFSGGLSFKTPFGTLFSPNITADPTAGIGKWTEEQFAKAVREGVSPEKGNLYPVFPYVEYSKISDADIHALYTYIKSLKPVAYTPPANKMNFPFGIRLLMKGWNMLYFQPGRYAANPAQSADWNRGAYLVEGLGHCGACHTPRNSLGAEQKELAYTGGTYLDAIEDAVHEAEIVKQEGIIRPWSAVNLTSHATGLGPWSLEEIEAYLKTGHNVRSGAFGPMTAVIENSTRHLTDQDRHAMAVYIKALPAKTALKGIKIAEDSARKGEIVYTVRCGDCHLPTGLGIPENSESAEKRAPPLVANAIVQAPDAASLINVILYGAHEAAQTDHTWPKMPGFETELGLDDDQIANLCDYLRSAWGNQGDPVSAAQVAKQR